MGYYVGSESGGIRTPGYVLAEMRTVDGFITSLNRDISQSPEPLPQSFVQGWASFAAEWKDFYDEHSQGIGSWFSRGTTPIYDKTEEYRALALLWRDRYVRQGGDPSAIDLRQAEKKFSIWPWLIGGAVVYGVVHLVFTKPKEGNTP